MMARRLQPPWRRRPIWVLLLVVAAVVFLRLRSEPEVVQPAPGDLVEGAYQVERVVDGDTIKLTNGARIRLIGVDTPETVMPNHPVEDWGPEASAFTKDFLRGGEARLQFDKERQDRYGRYLAYVYVGEAMLNEELIRAGLGTAELQYRYSDSMKTRFRKAEQTAREAGVGLWSK